MSDTTDGGSTTSTAPLKSALKQPPQYTKSENITRLSVASSTLSKKISWHDSIEGGFLEQRKSIPLIVFPTGLEDKNYFCSVHTLRTCVIVGLTLQLLCLILGVSLWICIYLVWPTTFAIEFQSGLEVLRNRYFVLVLGMGPIFDLILLSLAILIKKRRKSFSRLYYLLAPWLLLPTCLIGIKAVIFFGRLSRIDLEKQMQDSLIAYDTWNSTGHRHEQTVTHEVAVKGWDDLQRYFHCCGINNPEDWRRGYLEPENTNEWIVPDSCCGTEYSAYSIDCSTHPNKKNSWTTGCLDFALERFTLLGVLTILLCLVIFLVTVFCIAMAAEYYSSLRRGDGTHYEMSTKVYLKETFLCALCRGGAKIGPELWETDDTSSKDDQNWK